MNTDTIEKLDDMIPKPIPTVKVMMLSSAFHVPLVQALKMPAKKQPKQMA